MLEVIHFIPAIAIIASYLLGAVSSVRSNSIVLAVSLAAVLFGGSFHHSHAFVAFDPCVLYMFTAAFSAVKLVKRALAAQ